MKVTIHLDDGSRITVRRMDGVLELLEQWRDGDAPVLSVSLDDVAVTHVARAHIVRIDVDEPEDA